MRIFGDNSDGFRNEKNIAKCLNGKCYEDINPNLRHFLDDMFRGYNLRGKRVHAITEDTLRCKPDFYVSVDNIAKGFYVSVKKGSGNSIHQEKLSNFINYLRDDLGASDKTIANLKLYHFSDETTDNTGQYRYSSAEFSKIHPEINEELNAYFSDEDIEDKLFERFVFVGTLKGAVRADYIYHGTAFSGVWASHDEILNYVKTFCKKSRSVSIGPLTYQAWNKNINFNPDNENKRKDLQLKWGTLEDDLIKITSFRDYYRQNGTYEGDIDEKSSVIYFNRNPDNEVFKKYLKTIDSVPEKTLIIRVTTNQYSRLSNQKVKTRADAYAVEILDNKLLSLLEENAFYLDETILSEYTEYYKFIKHSGISIKLHDSDSYQIIKLTPNSFNKLFNSYELGVGISLFCQKEEELHKNNDVISGWNSSIVNMRKKFYEIYKQDELIFTSISVCKQIKTEAIKILQNIIDGNKYLQKVIFNGIDIYEEPYTAFFFMQNNEIKSLVYIPYTITTGSGRSHGDYSIVLKPKN